MMAFTVTRSFVFGRGFCGDVSVVKGGLRGVWVAYAETFDPVLAC